MHFQKSLLALMRLMTGLLDKVRTREVWYCGIDTCNVLFPNIPVAAGGSHTLIRRIPALTYLEMEAQRPSEAMSHLLHAPIGVSTGR